QALLDRGLAAGPAEDERDGGQQALGVEAFDDLRPARRPHARALSALPLPVGLAHVPPPAAAVAPRGTARLQPGHAHQVGVDGLLAALALLEQVVDPPPGEHVLE